MSIRCQIATASSSKVTASLKGAQGRTWPVSCVFASVARYGDAPLPDREAALVPSKLAYLTLCRSIQLLVLLLAVTPPKILVLR
jgi:hypothetical protein